MGMQISCGVHPEVPEEGVVCADAARSGSVFRGLANHKECRVGIYACICLAKFLKKPSKLESFP